MPSDKVTFLSKIILVEEHLTQIMIAEVTFLSKNVWRKKRTPDAGLGLQ